VSMPRIEEYAKTIARATKHPGNMDADFFVRDDGSVFLLELNPRFGGGYPFSHMAGANVPAALISWVEAQQPDPEWLRVSVGIRAYKDIRLVRRA
jgi:carbamoyl-phosphate synthase large subunit